MADGRSFLVYSAWTTLFNSLDEFAVGTIIKAICAKKDGLEYTVTDPILSSIYGMMQAEVDAAAEKYAKVCERRAAAGRLGGIAKRDAASGAAQDESKCQQVQANASKCQQVQANDGKGKLYKYENENEYKYENENENENENESPSETVSPSETTSPSGQEKHIAHARTRTQKNPAVQKHKHGEFGHVLLTDAEYNRLCDEKGREETDDAIRVVDEYAETSGKRYKNYSLAIQRWGYRAAAEQAAKERRAQIRPAGGFSAADYFARVARGEEAL